MKMNSTPIEINQTIEQIWIQLEKIERKMIHFNILAHPLQTSPRKWKLPKAPLVNN